MGRLVYIAAGEPSGEAHAARLVAALRRAEPGLSFAGLGGDAMRAQGVRLLAHTDRLAIMGFTEVLVHLPFLWRLRRRIRRFFDEERPDLAVFVDYPGYNLTIAREAKERSIPVLYYISPQVWAWKEHRKHKIADRVDRLALILPFEAPYYEGTGLRTAFVGHPSVEHAVPDLDREAFCRKHGLRPDARTLALFPGSRTMEIRHILPTFLRTARLLRQGRDDLQVALSLVPMGRPRALERAVERSAPFVTLVRDDRYNLLRHADAALSKSGTSNLEAAILGTPLVVCYRGPHLSYRIARWFHRLPFISLVNIVAGREVAPEFIQYAARPAAMARRLEELLDPGSPASRDQRRGLAEVREKLGGPGCSEKVARMAMELMDGTARAKEA